MATFLKLDINGNTTEDSGTSTSAGAADAGKLIQLDGTGKIAVTQLPNGVAADAVSLPASEALAAGAFVNIWSNAGTPSVRNAVATGIGMRADGYVNTAVASGATATVFFDDTNSGVTGLTAGAVYFLSAGTPGGVTTNPPQTTTDTGKIVQKLGVAPSATAIHVKISDPVIRA